MNLLRVRAKVVSVARLAETTFRLRVLAPEIAVRARPGQFVMVGPLQEASADPFLLRPFSIHRTSLEGTLDLVFAVVGRGTAGMSRLQAGQSLWLLGPQGRGFAAGAGADPQVLVAGGLGVAPLVFLAEKTVLEGRAAVVLYGVKSAAWLVPTADLSRLGIKVELATEDGTAGQRATAVDLLAACFEKLGAEISSQAAIAACGPWEMLRSVAAFGRSRGVPVELALEARMACGVGACLGCTLDLKSGKKRVCLDGPVFPAEEVFG